MKQIKIIAPSSYVPGQSSSETEQIVSFFKKLKYDVDFGEFSFHKHYFFAGNDSERLSDLENAFKDKKCTERPVCAFFVKLLTRKF